MPPAPGGPLFGMTASQEAQYALDLGLGPDHLKADARAEYDRLATLREYGAQHFEAAPAVPKPAEAGDDPVAGLDPAAVSQARYAKSYGGEDTLSPAAREAYDRLDAVGWPQARVTVQPKQDRSGWPKADHDGLAIASFITAWFIPLAGLIIGLIHVNDAHKKQMRASSLAAWGVGISIVGCIGWCLYWLFIIVLAIAAAHAGSAGYNG